MLICSREEIKEEFATFGAIVVEQGRHWSLHLIVFTEFICKKWYCTIYMYFFPLFFLGYHYDFIFFFPYHYNLHVAIIHLKYLLYERTWCNETWKILCMIFNFFYGFISLLSRKNESVLSYVSLRHTSHTNLGTDK
jgi:hypothetical protein